MEDKQHKIFNKGECLSEDMLLRYVNDQLTAKEKHMVEKHTLGCELCAHALEGIMLLKEPSQLKGIVENLNKRIGGAAEGRKPIILWMNTFMAIAAGLTLLIGLFFLFNTSLNKASDSKMVSDNLKQKEEIDKSPGEKEENFKTESTNTSPDESQASSKATSTIETQTVDGSRELAGKVPGAKEIVGGDDGNKQISKNAQDDLLRLADAPPPTELQEEKPSLDYPSTVGRSKLVDREVQSKQKKSIEKDSPFRVTTDKVEKSMDDEMEISGNETSIAKENRREEPAQLGGVDEDNMNYFSKKAVAPKREEKEQVLAKAEKRKDKNKNTETAEPQKPSDGENFANGAGNAGYISMPQPISPTGTAGAAAPSMAPQSNKGAQDISMLKNTADEGIISTINSNAKSDSDSYRTEIKKGKKRYRSNDYNQAVLLFTKALQTKPIDPEALYYLGCSYLELNKPDLAIFQFDKLINLGGGIYYDGARYNKASALIKQNKNAEAKILLENIVQTSTEFKSRATEALDKIK